MKLNILAKNFMLFFVFSVIFCHSSIAEIEWQREYGATVNNEYLSGAYLGGISYAMTCSKVTFCDEDNDGDYDAFLVGTTDKEWIAGLVHFRNDGTPLSPQWTLVPEEYGIIKGVNPWSTLAFCDIDGDGDQDMFAGETMYGSIHFYRNIGSATLPNWKLETENYIDGRAGIIDFCDIDGDSDYDMFIGDGGYLYYYQNDGNPHIPAWTLVTDAYNDVPVFINYGYKIIPEFCDIDKDGDFDLFIGEEDGNINFFRNDGTANFPNWTFITEDYCNLQANWASAPEFCDIDGDGDYDLFLDQSDGRIKFYRNDSTVDNPLWSLMTTSYFYIDAGYYSRPIFCDIDNDNDYDMFILGIWGLYFYQNNGSPYSPSWVLISDKYNGIAPTDNSYCDSVSFCDIDSDGDSDMFVTVYTYGENYNVWFYRNDGTPTSPTWVLVTKEYILLSLYSEQYAITFCDIDNDVDYDMFLSAASANGKHIYFYRNDGTPNTPVWTLVTSDYVISNNYSNVPTFVDIDNDGDYDLFIGQYYGGSICFYRNEGTPEESVWSLVTENYNSLNNYWLFGVSAFCDIDCDSDYDMFIGGEEGGITFWRNMTIVNTRPVASIIEIYPNPAYKDDMVSFEGTAEDSDEGDAIVAYKWTSNIDGQLSTEKSFSATTLSVGIHTITFEAQDSHTAWSEPATATLEVKLNTPPITSITSILPNPAYQGDSVTFTGTATDSDADDAIVAYEWTSSIDGLLSVEASFTTSILSLGIHTITFKAQDRRGTWSEPITATLEVKPLYELSLKDGQSVTGNVYVSMTYRGNSLPWFYFNVDGQYARYNPWMTQYFVNGAHTVYGQYYDWQKREWYKTDPIMVNVYNETSYAPEIISPLDGAAVSGSTTITFKAEGPRPYFATIYANDKVIGWKYLYGNSSPYNFAWQTTMAPNGQYSLKVVVYYLYAGYTVSKPVNIMVNNPVPPTLNITCPDPTSGLVNVAISSNDNNNFMLPILYVDGRFIGYRLRLPCTITWDTTKFANGPHVLHIQAYHILLRKWIVVDKTIQVQN